MFYANTMRIKRKPDLLAVLAIVVGLGVIATALAQGILAPADTGTHLASNQSNIIPVAAKAHHRPGGQRSLVTTTLR